uniref:Uncharacterized protein n=1 Tax=Anguilla anguilla TaxID=7936 RepID=A0A0E9PD33_ANGAN
MVVLNCLVLCAWARVCVCVCLSVCVPLITVQITLVRLGGGKSCLDSEAS